MRNPLHNRKGACRSLSTYGCARLCSTRPCPVRAACTRAKTEPRTITIRTQAYYAALQAARHDQTTAAFKEHDALRAGIESTLSQGVRAFGIRRSRYIGLAKTHLQHILIAVGINLK